MYCDQAVYIQWRNNEPHPHLYVILSEPMRGRDALVVSMVTHRTPRIQWATIPAKTVLTKPKEVAYVTSADSRLDMTYTDLLGRAQVQRVVQRGRSCGKATPWFRDFCRTNVRDWIDYSQNGAIERAIEELCEEWGI